MIALAAVLASQVAVEPLDAGSIRIRGNAVVGATQVKLADLADLSALPTALRERAGRIVLFKLGRAARPAAVSDRYVIARARALYPALAPWLPEPEGRQTRLSYEKGSTDTATSGGRRCLKVMRPLPAGAWPSFADLEPSECPRTGAINGFRYDAAAGSVRARRALEVGEVVVRFAGFGREMIRPHDRLSLRSVVGPVTVSREVEALQPAADGDRLFVRDGDGQIMSVRFQGAGR